MAEEKIKIFYVLKDKNELFGDKGRTITKDVYDLLPQVSKDRFELFNKNNKYSVSVAPLPSSWITEEEELPDLDYEEDDDEY